MDPSLQKRLHEFLVNHALLVAGREVHFIVAYSGGRDSTALLHALSQLKSELPIPIKMTAAYYWHPWRLLHQDIQVVAQNCKAMQLQWVMLTPDLTLPKTEAAARQDRYQQLAQLAADLNATAVLTAHQQDDQVETIMFRVLRGSGLEGVTGIPEIRMIAGKNHHEITVARPFLTVSREDIDAYIQAHHLSFVQDPTNQDTRFKRNFIRHELLPKLEEAFPQARQSLLNLTEMIDGDLKIIESKIDEVWADVFEPKTDSLDEVIFAQLSPAYQRRILKRFLAKHQEEASYRKINDILEHVIGAERNLYQPALFSLGPNRFIFNYRNRITIESPQKFSIEPLEVSIPGEVCHRELKAQITITPLTSEERLKPVDYSKLPSDEILVDLSNLDVETLVLRARQKGDKIRPLGMTNPVKLKRYLINRYIPRFQRDSIPLLAKGSEILWAVGVGLSEDIRVKNRPTHRISIKKDHTHD